MFIVIELAYKGSNGLIISGTSKQCAHKLICFLGISAPTLFHVATKVVGLEFVQFWMTVEVLAMPRTNWKRSRKFRESFAKPEHRGKNMKGGITDCAVVNTSDVRLESANSIPPLARDVKHYLADLAANVDPEMDEEQMRTMTQNVLTECKGQELSLICDREAATHLQHIVNANQQGRLEFLSRILYKRGKNVVQSFQTASGSRCFEQLLLSTIGINTETLAQQRSILLKSATVLLENMASVWSNLYSVHTLRCVGRLLVGANTENDDELRAAFNSLVGKILDWKYKDYLNDEAFSLLSQDFLRFDALHNGEFTAKLSSEILKETAEVVRNQWCDKQASRFWEQLIRFSPNSFLNELYPKHLQNHLIKLSVHRFANFPVQRYFERCSNVETVSLAVEEMLNGFSDIWNSKNLGVVVSLMNAAKGIEPLECKLLKKLRRILNCAKGDNHDLLPSVLTLGKFGSFSNEVEPLYFGSVLAQCLLRYAEKKEIVTSTVRLPAEQIVKLGCHQYGSHYVEAFLRSANTDDRKVFNVKLQPCIFQLANNKYGSRVVEAALDTSDTDGKALFLKSLVTHEKELLSTAHDSETRKSAREIRGTFIGGQINLSPLRSSG
uniref:PUM-HD domain-containing protein n=1 Tax=Trichuris muris TaxID=70415 RepID=A0A5S6QN39_TRIMR